MRNRIKLILLALPLIGAVFLARNASAELDKCDDPEEMTVYNTDNSLEEGPLNEARTLQWKDYPECRNNDVLFFEDQKTGFNRAADVGHISQQQFWDAYYAFGDKDFTAEEGYDLAIRELGIK